METPANCDRDSGEPGENPRNKIASEAQPLLYYCKNRQILRTSVKTALVVGAALALINHFDGITRLSLTSTEVFQILITFLVPFSVATYSAARHMQHLAELGALAKPGANR